MSVHRGNLPQTHLPFLWRARFDFRGWKRLLDHFKDESVYKGVQRAAGLDLVLSINCITSKRWRTLSVPETVNRGSAASLSSLLPVSALRASGKLTAILIMAFV